MANPEHLEILKQGVEDWNKWREENPDIEPDLYGADLECGYFAGGNFRKTNLYRANFTGADLEAADLRGANLGEANLLKAFLVKADLSESNLILARLAEANFVKTNLTGVRVWGVSAWGLQLEGAIQKDLVISHPFAEANNMITVDNLEVAQFIYLLLHNDKIRQIIDTITSKVVLILGRFAGERKAVLDAIRDELRMRNYLPVLFDFDKPANRDLTETISTLAHMARFIIADITDARSIPQELQAVVPNLPSVPVQPLLLGSSTEYGMFEHFRRYQWVLPICRYDDQEELIQSIQTKVIAPAEEMVKRAADQVYSRS
jgi:uncharacterized protein YjbI with pentapeptide repeats